jgi:hypothetical protein
VLRFPNNALLQRKECVYVCVCVCVKEGGMSVKLYQPLGSQILDSLLTLTHCYRPKQDI